MSEVVSVGKDTVRVEYAFTAIGSGEDGAVVVETSSCVGMMTK